MRKKLHKTSKNSESDMPMAFCSLGALEGIQNPVIFLPLSKQIENFTIEIIDVNFHESFNWNARHDEENEGYIFISTTI